jgi:hypothetical protein
LRAFGIHRRDHYERGWGDNRDSQHWIDSHTSQFWAFENVLECCGVSPPSLCPRSMWATSACVFLSFSSLCLYLLMPAACDDN